MTAETQTVGPMNRQQRSAAIEALIRGYELQFGMKRHEAIKAIRQDVQDRKDIDPRL